MRFDLKTPCKHCPFRNDSRRITFACRERAEEIEEIAYREGFVCHQHGEMTEGFDGEEFIEFKEDGSSQHCAGALLMFLRDGGGNVPWEDLSDKEQNRIASRLDWNAPVFESSEEFIDANVKADPAREKKL